MKSTTFPSFHGFLAIACNGILDLMLLHPRRQNRLIDHVILFSKKEKSQRSVLSFIPTSWVFSPSTIRTLIGGLTTLENAEFFSDLRFLLSLKFRFGVLEGGFSWDTSAAAEAPGGESGLLVPLRGVPFLPRGVGTEGSWLFKERGTLFVFASDGAINCIASNGRSCAVFRRLLSALGLSRSEPPEACERGDVRGASDGCCCCACCCC